MFRSHSVDNETPTLKLLVVGSEARSAHFGIGCHFLALSLRSESGRHNFRRVQVVDPIGGGTLRRLDKEELLSNWHGFRTRCFLHTCGRWRSFELLLV